MKTEKVITLKNDGVNMASDEKYLYARAGRGLYKYDLQNFTPVSSAEPFKKDGKSRGIGVSGDHVCLYDFCDLHIIEKNDLRTVFTIRLGDGPSSDVCGLLCDGDDIFASVRNGRVARIDKQNGGFTIHNFAGASFWDTRAAGNFIYAGCVSGELFEIDKTKMRIVRSIRLCKKNVYGLAVTNKTLYAISQDTAIRAVSLDTFETVNETKKAAGGMISLAGVYNGMIYLAAWNKISVYDATTLKKLGEFEFPTGHYNKGALLAGGVMFGSDENGIYRALLPEKF